MTIKIGVVGAGRWGKNHISTLKKMKALGGIVDPKPSLEKEYKGLKCFHSLDQKGALDFDAYTVAVPAELHFETAKKLLLANKHVLVEKPITLNPENAQELVDLAESKNLILMVGHLLLFHPAFIKMKQIIKEGQIGNIQYIYSNRLNLGTVRTEENSLWSFAPHDISLFQFFIDSYPTKISCEGGAFLQPKIHDTTMTMLTYPKNVVGHIFVSWLHPFKEHRFVIVGSKGMLSYEDSSEHKNLYLYSKGIDFVEGAPVIREGKTEIIDYDKTLPLDKELEHFIACVKGKEKNTIIEGKKGLEVLEILKQAHTDLTEKKMKVKKKTPNHYFAHESSVIDQTADIQKNVKIWGFCNIQKHSKIGEHTIVGQNVNIGPNVTVGKHCKIQNNVSIYEGVELENYVFCGPSMVFTNVLTPRCKYPVSDAKKYRKTLVKEGASIGANATIVCGTTIGKNAFIGAGSVVISDVPDHSIVVGNPAKHIGWMSEGGLKLDFSTSKTAYCEKSKKTYKLVKNKVIEI